MHKLKRFLLEKYEISLVNKKTYKQYFSKQITKLHILSGILIFFVFTLGLMFYLVNYVPGFQKIFLRSEYFSKLQSQKKLQSKIEFLEAQLKEQEQIINFLQNTFDVSNSSEEKEKVDEELRDLIHQEVTPVSNVSGFRSVYNKKLKTESFFILPVNGPIVRECNVKDTHLGVDIAAKEGTPVLAMASGRVIFSEFSYETGYVIILQHANNLISVYKHNSKLAKQVGDFVKKGEVISYVGSSGEYSTGPHLHFEIWYDGKFIDPKILWTN